MSTRKIGIMGGTFNPIHNAHIAVALAAYQTFALEKVIFIPAGNPYFKTAVPELGEQLASAADRLAMTRLAIAGFPQFEASDMEIVRGGLTYTADTLETLAKTGDEYYFIMGADSFLSLHLWKKPEVIFENAVIVAAIRPAQNENTLREERKLAFMQQKERLERQFPNAHIEPLLWKESAVSSTAVREALHSRRLEEAAACVPQAVLEYIVSRRLYGYD